MHRAAHYELTRRNVASTPCGYELVLAINKFGTTKLNNSEFLNLCVLVIKPSFQYFTDWIVLPLSGPTLCHLPFATTDVGSYCGVSVINGE